MAGLLDGARRRGEFGWFWGGILGAKDSWSEGKTVRALRGAAERCSEFATANCGASGGGAATLAVPAFAVVY